MLDTNRTKRRGGRAARIAHRQAAGKIQAPRFMSRNIPCYDLLREEELVRIEEHAGEFLLYLDFSRTMSYRVNGKCYSKDGFVWGRYAKDIADMDELYESVEFLINEFIEEYTKANKL